MKKKAPFFLFCPIMLDAIWFVQVYLMVWSLHFEEQKWWPRFNQIFVPLRGRHLSVFVCVCVKSQSIACAQPHPWREISSGARGRKSSSFSHAKYQFCCWCWNGDYIAPAIFSHNRWIQQIHRYDTQMFTSCNPKTFVSKQKNRSIFV